MDHVETRKIETHHAGSRQASNSNKAEADSSATTMAMDPFAIFAIFEKATGDLPKGAFSELPN